MNRLSVITAAVVAVVVVLVAAEPSLAGPLQEIGKNTQTEVGGLVKALFLVAIICLFSLLAWQRAYPAMVLAFIACSIVASFIFDPQGAGQTLSSVGKSLMPGGK